MTVLSKIIISTPELFLAGILFFCHHNECKSNNCVYKFGQKIKNSNRMYTKAAFQALDFIYTNFHIFL